MLVVKLITLISNDNLDSLGRAVDNRRDLMFVWMLI